MAVKKLKESILSDIYKEVRGRYPDLKYKLFKYSGNNPYGIGTININGFHDPEVNVDIDKIDRFIKYLANKNNVELHTTTGPRGVWGPNGALTYTFSDRKTESLKEGYSDRHITLKFKSNSTLPYKVYDSLFDLTANGIIVDPKYDDIPLGWDSSVDIVGGKVVLEGELVPGGADPGCICKITLSPEKVDNYYDIYVDANEEDYDEVVDLLTKCNLM